MTEQVIQYRDDLPRCFIDTVVIDDGEVNELVAVGCVRADGGEFHALNIEAPLHRLAHSVWDRTNIMERLPAYSDEAWMTPTSIRSRLAEFTKGSHELWGNQCDSDALNMLYKGERPNLFPRSFDLAQLAWLVGNPDIRFPSISPHDVLAGARRSKELYEFLRSVPSGVWGYEP